MIKTYNRLSESLVQTATATLCVTPWTNFRHAYYLSTWSPPPLRHLSQWESNAWKPSVNKNTSSAWSQLITPAAKQFLRGLKDWSLKVLHLDCVVKGMTLPIHTGQTIVCGHLGCLGCLTFMENGDIKVEPSQLVASNGFFQSIQ
jgi:hypothetical protein